MTADATLTGSRFIAVEFYGKGDPFFGGTADDRPLLKNGRFASCPRREDVARFPDREASIAAAEKAPNRRPGGLLSAFAEPAPVSPTQ